MSESILKPLHSFRHKHLFIKNMIIFLTFFDTVQNQHVLHLKDSYVGTIIVAHVKYESFESTLQSSADIMFKYYDTVLRKEVDR